MIRSKKKDFCLKYLDCSWVQGDRSLFFRKKKSFSKLNFISCHIELPDDSSELLAKSFLWWISVILIRLWLLVTVGNREVRKVFPSWHWIFCRCGFFFFLVGCSIVLYHGKYSYSIQFVFFLTIDSVKHCPSFLAIAWATPYPHWALLLCVCVCSFMYLHGWMPSKILEIYVSFIQLEISFTK